MAQKKGNCSTTCCVKTEMVTLGNENKGNSSTGGAIIRTHTPPLSILKGRLHHMTIQANISPPSP
jgi:hypothetical protein